MNRKLQNSILLIITYTLLLVVGLVKSDYFFGAIFALLSALKPLFFGFAIAFVLNRPCDRLEIQFQHILPHSGQQYARPLAVGGAYAILIACLGGLLAFVVPQVAESISIFLGSLEGALKNLQLWINQMVDYFHLEALQNVQFDFSQLSTYLNQFMSGMMGNMSSAAGEVVAFTGNLFSNIITGVLALVFSIYMLSGGENLRRQCSRVLHAYVPKKQANRIQRVADISAVSFSNFISGQLTEAVILGGLCAIGTLFIMADYAPLVGIIVGFTSLIPIAGAYIGAIFSAFLILMISPIKAVIFLIFLTVLQQIEGNVIYPRVVGTTVGLPGIWVLAAVTVGGGLFGLWGILLSVPIVSILYTLLREDVRSRLNSDDPDN